MPEYKSLTEYKEYINQLSLENIIDIRDHIDQIKYPDRYAIVLAALNECKYSKKNIDSKKEVRGFGGWLILFSVIISIVTPYFGLLSIIKVFGNTQYLFTISEKIKYIVCMDFIYQVVISIYGVWVVIFLYKKDNNALKHVYRYLWIYLFGRTIILSFPLLVGLPWSFLPGSKDKLLIGLLNGPIFFTLWFIYFKTSKRVRNTYKCAG